MPSMTQDDVVAVVLGGGGPDDRLARTAGAPSKALVPVEGAPLGAYVLSALRDSGAVREIVFVGPTDARIAAMVDAHLPGGERLVDSLALGLGAALGRGGRRLLVVTADIPWWTAEGVRGFLADAPESDLVYPVVRGEDADAAFPGQRRTCVRLVEGRVTGGNAVILRADAVARLLPWIDRAYRARKRPLQLAGMVGWGTLARLLAGRASIALLEARVSALVGIQGRIFVSSDAAIAADVDGPEHLSSTPVLPSLPLPSHGGAA
jgi:CTP:molybdopterin cytidylyltransferase MocA